MGMAHRTIFLSMVVATAAFFFGTLIDLPVIQYFCWHTAFGFIGLYISMWTVYLGSFVLLEKHRFQRKVWEEESLLRIKEDSQGVQKEGSAKEETAQKEDPQQRSQQAPPRMKMGSRSAADFGNDPNRMVRPSARDVFFSKVLTKKPVL